MQWETNWGRDTFGRLPLSLSLELIAVLQSVWFDFIGAIWFSNVTLRVWLEPRQEPNWGILLSSCCCHSHRAGNKDLAGFISLFFFPLLMYLQGFTPNLSLIFHYETLIFSHLTYAPLKFPAAYLPTCWDSPEALACNEWRNWIGFRYDNHHCRSAPGCTQHSFYVIPVISRYTLIQT